uniref:Uncharacterized protein n=1 Tax=Megaviridae environmental sample TaxID=1737588 RepID=A0A5J6VKC1_9VIRU|nr:MAG: hypothetical protein [Megaviridae environmental sample]
MFAQIFSRDNETSTTLKQATLDYIAKKDRVQHAPGQGNFSTSPTEDDISSPRLIAYRTPSDRFYVMALQEIKATLEKSIYWYENIIEYFNPRPIYAGVNYHGMMACTVMTQSRWIYYHNGGLYEIEINGDSHVVLDVINPRHYDIEIHGIDESLFDTDM